MTVDLAFELSVSDVNDVDEMDFGDAPDPNYPTLLFNDGARHVIVPGVYMGQSVDSEPNGQPDASATGDDIDGNNDDDGVLFSGSGTMSRRKCCATFYRNPFTNVNVSRLHL